MMTRLIDQPTAQAQLNRAKAQVQRLVAEQATIPKRKRAARAAIERLTQQIVQLAREGAEAATLEHLRGQRANYSEIVRDDLSERAAIRKIQRAQDDLTMAERAVVSSEYNALVQEQRKLAKQLATLIATVLVTLHQKERLAERQNQISARIRPAIGQTPEKVRGAYAVLLAQLLERPLREGAPYIECQVFDWSCKPMSAQGDLLDLSADESLHGF